MSITAINICSVQIGRGLINWKLYLRIMDGKSDAHIVSSTWFQNDHDSPFMVKKEFKSSLLRQLDASLPLHWIWITYSCCFAFLVIHIVFFFVVGNRDLLVDQRLPLQPDLALLFVPGVMAVHQPAV